MSRPTQNEIAYLRILGSIVPAVLAVRMDAVSKMLSPLSRAIATGDLINQTHVKKVDRAAEMLIRTFEAWTPDMKSAGVDEWQQHIPVARALERLSLDAQTAMGLPAELISVRVEQVAARLASTNPQYPDPYRGWNAAVGAANDGDALAQRALTETIPSDEIFTAFVEREAMS